MSVRRRILILVFSHLIKLCYAGEFSNCTAFVEIPESSQDKDPSSLSDLTKRPLGFASSVLMYDTSDPPPCARISGLTGSQPKVEIMVETITPNAKMCVESNDGSAAVCGQGQLSFCRDASATDISYEFDCSGEGCETVDVQFWYRITKGDPDDEYWCDSRSSGDFPSSLLVLPGTVPPGPTDGDKNPKSSASRILYFHWMGIMSCVVVMLIYWRTW